MRQLLACAVLLGVPACERDLPSPHHTAVAEAAPGGGSLATELALAALHPAAHAFPWSALSDEPPLYLGTDWFRRQSLLRQSAGDYLCRRSVEDPCAGLLRADAEDGEPDPVFAAQAMFVGADQQHLYDHCMHAFGPTRACDTPLLVSFDGAVPRMAPASAARFAFHRGDPIASEWPTAATPWIALDRDGDGAITAGDELFGDASGARDGFEALTALDANHDGRIDAADPAYSKLVLWFDRDGNHASSPDELVPLSSVVTSIALAHDDAMRGALTWRGPDGTAHAGAAIDLYVRQLAATPR
jgi:hypothetical protein